MSSTALSAKSANSARGVPGEPQLGPAALSDRDHDVADVRGVDREAEATQRVEVVDADADQLGVSADVREELQRADRPGVLGPELGQRLR